MSFFLQLHRNIFDPSSYRTIDEVPRPRVALYVVKLLLLAAIVAGTAHTLYLFTASRGVAAPLNAAFGGMEIKNGELLPNRPLPYEVASPIVADLFSRLFDLSEGGAPGGIPTVIVDTAAKPLTGAAFPRVLMGKKEIVIQTGPTATYPLSYEDFFLGSRNMQFSIPFIKKFLAQKAPWMIFYYCLYEGIRCLGLLFFCISILAIAPYIFRIDRQRKFSHFLSIAGFSASPIPVGFMLIAISGAAIPAAADIFVIVSAIVMFRALGAIRTGASKPEKGEDLP